MAGFDDDEDEVTGGTGTVGTGLLGGGLPAVVQAASVVVQAPVGTTLGSIPNPRPPAGDGELTPQEQEALTACKAGMNNLQTAFWVAGKSLETMKTGNLHRNEGVPNFGDYVMDTWEVSESQTHRLMDAWRIGEALAAMGWTPREAQIRELTDVRNESGDQAAVAVYDTVARSVRRVTAKLLSEVVRELPPLPRQASSADVRKLVQEILAARAAATAASQTSPTGVPASNGGVPNITSIGKEPTGENSPIGESGSEPSNPKGSGDSGGDDIRRLAAALDDLRGVERRLSKPAVKRALAHDSERTEALMKQIDEALNRIGRTIAVRRTDA
ncbi:hypothetical protein [Streptomyces mirabilis]|uniref:hypothetical protein n=1 Tax=Streptomyces mirabilis TaxID=68239 RepID=UPI0036ACE553